MTERAEKRVIADLGERELAEIRADAMDFADVGLYRYRMDGTLLFIDRGALRLLDLEDEIADPSTLVGRNIAELLDYVDTPGRLRDVTRERGAVRDYEYRYRTLKGEERWVYHSSYLVEDPSGADPAVQVIARDITELKRTSRALAASERRFRALTESSQQCVVVSGGDPTRILFANPAFYRLLDRPAQELIGARVEDLLDLCPPEDRAIMRRRLAALERGDPKSETVEVRVERRDGTLVWISLLSAPVEFDGVSAFQTTFVDVTARREAEERRREIEKKHESAQRLESLGVLAGGIAHDFNNLLTGILGNAELAGLRLGDDPETREHLDEILRATDRAAELCRQLLAYSGGSTLAMRPLDIGDLVRDTRRLLDLGISKKARLEHAFAGDLPAVNGDASQLRQLAMNLLTNASEALEGRPGTIALRTGDRRLSREALSLLQAGAGAPTGRYVYFEVEDDGVGMDDATRARIFEPFFTTKFTGRGLGLAAAVGIVRSHGGALECESAPGRGTRIRVYLPALEAPVDGPVPDARGAASWGVEGAALLADDEEASRRSTSRMLEAFGLGVDAVPDGRRALDLFAAEPDRFAVVMLDVVMPALDGRECFREIRALRPEVPVLFFSGYDQSSVGVELADRRDTAFLQKPFCLADLERVLRELLDIA